MPAVKNAKKIAIQGGYGAFHEIAAKHYFGNDEIEILPIDTFNELFETLDNHGADYGITAIENTLAGSILPNYSLILESKMKIVGEIYLRIKQNLVALHGQTIENIQEVYSHPMALLQCQQFFKQYRHIKLIDSNDTALSAQKIAIEKLQNIGAIASKLAAETYKLEILAPGIETNKKNYTRFLILRDQNEQNHFNQDEVNKASLHFTISHRIGGLSKILSTLSFYDINLTKIQSMPIVGREWEYQFYVDVMFDDYEIYQQSMKAIEPFTGELHIMGEYKKGKSIIE